MCLTKIFINNPENFDEAMIKILSGGIPSRFDKTHLTKIGFDETNSVLYLKLFFIIGLIDKKGRPTKDFERLISSEKESRIVLGKKMRWGYKEVFIEDTQAHMLPVDKVADIFRKIHGDETSDTFLRFLSRTFKALADYVYKKEDSSSQLLLNFRAGEVEEEKFSQKKLDSLLNTENNVYEVLGEKIRKLSQKRLKNLVDTENNLFSILGQDIRKSLEEIFFITDCLQDEVKDEPEGQAVLEALKKISQSARSTSDLLNNQLNWFFLHLTNNKLSFEELDIHECTKKAIDIYMPNASYKNIKINLQSAKGIKIKGHWDLLSVLLRNLFSNAIKYSDDGSPVDVAIDEEKESVIMSVQDHGIGIPDDIKSRLFDPDERPLRQGSNGERSSGMGLLLCEEIVALHGGSITVESEENKGTTFSVSLPKNEK